MKGLINKIDKHTIVSSIILNGGLSIILWLMAFYITNIDDIALNIAVKSLEILSMVINFIIIFRVDTYKEYFKKVLKNLVGIVLSVIILYIFTLIFFSSMVDTSEYSASNWGAMGLLLIGIIYYMSLGLMYSAIIRLIVKVIQDIFKKRKEF